VVLLLYFFLRRLRAQFKVIVVIVREIIVGHLQDDRLLEHSGPKTTLLIGLAVQPIQLGLLSLSPLVESGLFDGMQAIGCLK